MSIYSIDQNSIGNPFDAKRRCNICDKNHRHFSGIQFAQKYEGKKKLCPCCMKEHVIGFKKNEVNHLFLGTSSFHNIHFSGMIFETCVIFETICGGKINDLLNIYLNFINKMKDFQFNIILSAGLNDFKRYDLDRLKSMFSQFKMAVSKNKLHSINFGTLLKAPTLYLSYDEHKRKCNKNAGSLEKFSKLNTHILTLSKFTFKIDNFGYGERKKDHPVLRPKRWREYKQKKPESLANCLHLTDRERKIALKSLLNQVNFKISGKAICK